MKAFMPSKFQEGLAYSSCGWASLNLMGLVSRSTSDVDILCAAQMEAKGKVRLLVGTTLPAKFAELIAEVGRELGLKEEWCGATGGG